MKPIYIIGGGIAGITVAWQLYLRNIHFILIDQPYLSSSSKIAAGIMHPITGRRVVKSWNADTFIPFAKKFYKEIEVILNQKLFFDTIINEYLDSIQQYNVWTERSGDVGYSDYIGNISNSTLYNSKFKAEVINTGWLDTKKFIESSINYFQIKNYIQVDHIIDKEITTLAMSHVIIDCRGWLASQSSLWSHLPWQPAKGEIMIIESASLKTSNIENKNVFIQSIGENKYKVGSTYAWDKLNDLASKAALDKLMMAVRSMIGNDYVILEQLAGVRPATRDRRPFIQKHEKYQIYILNGLGAKGIMMAPYLGKLLASVIIGDPLANQIISSEYCR
ncbi:MAG: hypothetical protein RIQ89_1960 [Bacteroidota bacterium]|jgi:glycine/D-amino acid oxidase-like deaminating enzyme